MLKRILGLSLAALILLCLAAGGTWAYFSDTESSTDNAFTAGTLNLQVGDEDPLTADFSISDVKPGDKNNAAVWEIQNTGSLDGNFSVVIDSIINQENGRNEVEEAVGDTSDGTDSNGELGQLLKIAIWMDTGTGDNYYLDPSGSEIVPVTYASSSGLPEGAFFSVDSFNGKGCGALQTINRYGNGGSLSVDYYFPDTDYHDNIAQSDSCVFNLLFSLNQ